MKKEILTILTLCYALNSYSQNLVPNFSFESQIVCPTNISFLNFAAPWFTTLGPLVATPDLFDPCGPVGVNGMPTNLFGSQDPLTGNAYAGLISDNDGDPSAAYNEYITVPLASSLQPGICYYTEMYVSLAEESQFAMDKLGMYFSPGVPTSDNGPVLITNPTPQVFATSVITNTSTWVKVSGTFTAAGGETHLTIGQFFNFGNFQEISMGSGSMAFPYYYIENVSVVSMAGNVNIFAEICEGDCYVFNDYSLCEDDTYFITAEDCNGNSSPVLANVFVYFPEEVTLSSTGVITCITPSVLLDASASTGLNSANHYWLGPNSFYDDDPVTLAYVAGTYYFTVDTPQGCYAVDSVIVEEDLEPPHIQVDSLPDWDCITPTMDLIGSSNTPGATVLWSGPGVYEFTNSVTVGFTGSYTFTVTGTNGCTSTADIEIPYGYFIYPEVTAQEPALLDCNNTISNLSASGNAADMTYLWTGPGVNVPNTFTQTDQPGIYTFTATTSFGCSASTPVEVLQDINPPFVEAFPVTDVNCNTGVMNLEAFAIPSDVSYHWTGPGVEGYDSGIGVSQAGTYTLIVTSNENGCTGSTQFVLTEEEIAIPTMLDIQPVAVLDCNASSVSLFGETNVSGATYIWTGPALNDTSQMSSANLPGIYTLIATAPNGCFIEDSIVVTQNSEITDLQIYGLDSLNCSTTEVTLYGTSSALNLTYLWTGPGVNILNDSVIITSPGNYTLIVTDTINGCNASELVTVNQVFDNPQSDAGVDGLLDCISTNYELDGGNSTGDNLSYGWYNSNGDLLSANSTYNVMQPGVYTLVVTNTGNGCSSTDQVTVTQDADVPTSDAGVDGLLDCSNTNYQLDGSNSSGDNLSYGWYNSIGDLLSANSTFLATQSGDYTLVVTNTVNGCSSTDQVNVAQDAEVPTSNAGADGLLTCTNTNYQLDGSNSTGDNLGYGWYNSIGDLLSANNTFDVSQTGDYTLIVTNTANGCSATDQVSVTQDADLPVSDAGVDGLLDCSNTTYELDGNNSSGDSLTFGWYNSIGDLLSINSTHEVTQSGDYTLVVTNAVNGCSSSDQVNVAQDADLPVSDAGVDGLLNCNTLIYQLDGSNSSGDNLSYIWYDSNGNVLGVTSTFSVTQPDDYVLIVTNTVSSCSSTDQVTVLQDVELPIANAGPDVEITCDNPSVDLDASGSIGNNLSFTWFDQNGTVVGTGPTISVFDPETCTVVVTNTDNGCTATDVVSISIDQDLPIADAGPDGLLDCVVSSYNLDGSNSLGPNLDYAWYNSSGDLVGQTQTLDVTLADDYLLIVTNTNNGCTATDEVAVAQDADVPTSNAGVDGLLDCINISYQLDGNSSTGNNISYSWYNATGDLIGTSAVITVTQPDDFILIVTAANGCSSTDQVTVLQDIDAPIADAGSDAVITCNNPSVDLDASGSTGNNLTFTWFDENGNVVGTGPTISVFNPETCTVVVTNTENGCTATDVVTVSVDLDEPIADAGADGLLDCTVASYNLDGSNSAGPNLDYAWYNAAGDLVGTDPTLDVTIADDYLLVVTNNNNGCTATDEVTVTQDADVPASNAGVDGLLNCNNTSYQLDGSASTGNNITYNWYNAAGDLIGTSAVITVAQPDDFILIVTAANGCSATDQVTVTQDIDTPAAVAGPDVVITCNNPSVDLDASGSTGNNLIFTWYDAAGNVVGTGPTISVFNPETCTVVVTNTENGCTATDVVTVSMDIEEPIAEGGADGLLDCTVASYNLDGSNSTGQNLEFSWYNSAGDLIGTDLTLDVTQPDDYLLILTNSNNGCTATDEVTVTQDADVPTSNAGVDGLLNCNITSYQLDGSASTGDNLNYTWYNSAGDLLGISAVISVTQPDDFTLIVTAANGCSSTDVITVLQDVDAPIADAGSDAVITCNNPGVDLDASGSTGNNLTFVWYDASGNIVGTGPTISVFNPETCTVVVTNTENGCTATDVVTVSVDLAEPIAEAGVDGILDCTVSSYNLNGSNSTGPNLEYFWYNSTGDLIGTDQTLDVTLADDYLLMVTNGDNGCTATDEVTVSQDADVPTANAGVDGLLGCLTPSYELDGSASIGDNLSYVWYDSNGDEIGTDATLSVTQPADFILVVTNVVNGCSSTDQATVSQDVDVPSSNAGVDGLLDCVTPSYLLDGSASLGDNLSYTWYDSNGDEVGTNATLPVTQSGDYILVVTNTLNGCSSTDQATVNQDADVPTSNAGFDGLLDCLTPSYELVGTASVGDNLSYVWYDNNGVELGTNSTLSVNQSGGYILVVTNTANGCSSTDQVSVDQDVDVPTSNAGVDGLLDCLTPNYELDGSASLGDNLGYVWYDNNGDEIGTNATLSVTQSGDYVLVVTNSVNGCSSTDQVSVNQDTDTPISDAGVDGLLDCITTNYELDGSNSIGSNLAFAWLDNNGDFLGANSTLEVAQSGNYTLVVTNTINGCSATDEVIVTSDVNAPIPNAGADGLLNCLILSYELDGEATGGSNLSYAWYNSAGDLIASTENTTVTEPDNYTLVVTNETNGCSATDEIVVTQDIAQPVSNAGGDGLLTCISTSYDLDGSASLGNNLSYAWYNAIGDLVGMTSNVSVNEAGAYTLLITNMTNGCTATDEVDVFENTVLPLAAADVGGLLNCAISETILDGGGSSGAGLTFAWFNGNNQLVGSEQTVTVGEVGTYILVVTDQVNGCTQSDEIEVLGDFTEPIAFANTVDNLDCFNESANITGEGSSSGQSYTYQWSGSGEITNPESINAVVSDPGVFTLLVTDLDNGCTATATTEVIYDGSFPGAPEVTVIDPFCYGDLGATFVSDVSGGLTPYLYSIDGGNNFESSNFFSDLPSGTYNLIVQDAEGCEHEEVVIIPEPEELLLNLTPELELGFGDSLQLSPQINIPNDQIASIQWTPSIGLSCTDCLTPVVTATQSITYYLTIVDINGCEVKASILLNVDKTQDIYIPTAFSPNGDDHNDAFMIYSAANTIREINFLRIYNRWGELVFENIDFHPGDESHGWNGYFEGQKLNPGVLVYITEVEWIDGRIELLKGDVTLMD